MQIKGYIRRKDLQTVTVATQTLASDMSPLGDYAFVLQNSYLDGTITSSYYADNNIEEVIATFSLVADGYYWYQLVVMPINEADADQYDFEYYLDGETVYKKTDDVWAAIESSEQILMPDNYTIQRYIWSDNVVTATMQNWIASNPKYLSPTEGYNPTPIAYPPITLVYGGRAAAQIEAFTKAMAYDAKATELITLNP